MRRNTIGLFVGIVAVFTAFALPLFAADIRVGSSITVPMTVGSSNITLELLAGQIDAFEVQSDKIFIDTDTTEKAYISGPTNISVVPRPSGVSFACNTGKTVIEISHNLAVVLNFVIPATTDNEYKNTCDGASGNAGGGTISSSSPTSYSPPPPPPPAVTPTPAEPPAPTVSDAERASSFTDLEKLPETQKSDVKSLVELMLKYKTFKMPAGNKPKYVPRAVVTGKFGLQVWNAVAGIGCGSTTKFPGFSACKKQAASEGLVKSSFNVKNKIARIDNYAILLKAAGIPLEKATKNDLKKECPDMKKVSTAKAQIFMTAKKYGIAKVYKIKGKGEQCKLTQVFDRGEAAHFAMRATEAAAAR